MTVHHGAALHAGRSSLIEAETISRQRHRRRPPRNPCSFRPGSRHQGRCRRDSRRSRETSKEFLGYSHLRPRAIRRGCRRPAAPVPKTVAGWSFRVLPALSQPTAHQLRGQTAILAAVRAAFGKARPSVDLDNLTRRVPPELHCAASRSALRAKRERRPASFSVSAHSRSMARRTNSGRLKPNSRAHAIARASRRLLIRILIAPDPLLSKDFLQYQRFPAHDSFAMQCQFNVIMRC